MALGIKLQRFQLATVILAALVIGSTVTARADFHIWTGAVSGYWSNTNNWQNGNVPNLFESAPVEIEFPSGVARTAVTNDIYFGIFGPLYVDSIIVSDNYLIAGKGNGTNIVMTGNAAPFFGINLQNFYCVGTNVTFDSSLNLILNNTNTITNTVNSALDIQATLTGSGGWIFQGSGQMTLDGGNPNTYTGPSTVLGGKVVLGKQYCYFNCTGLTAINGPLTIGTGFLGASAQVVESNSLGSQLSGAPVTINATGSLVLAGYSPEVVTNLTLAGGRVSFPGIFAFNTYQNPGTNYGSLTVGTITNYSTFFGFSSVIQGHGANSYFGFSSAGLNLIAPGSNLPPVLNVISGNLVLDTEINSDLTVSNVIKTGPGSLAVNGINQYSASTLIEQGSVVASGTNYSALGELLSGTTNQVVVFNGAQLIVNSNATFSTPVILNGYGPNGNSGALLVQADGALFTYGVVAATDAGVVVTNPAYNVTFAGYYAAALSGSGNFHKMGPGNLILNFLPGANPITGTTFVDQGTLTLDVETNVFNEPTLMLNGPLVIGTNGSTASSSVVIQVPQQMLGSNLPVTINDGGELYLDGNAQTVGSLALNGGAVAFGNLVLHGDITAQNGITAPQFFLAGLSLGGTNRIITVAANSTLSMFGGISDGGNNAGFTKAGPGELDLLGSGTYGGSTQVNAGRLVVDNGSALGTTTSGTIVASGGEIDLTDGIKVGAEALSLTGVGTDGLGALKGTGTNSWAGPITLAGLTYINVATNGQTELGGAISGPGGLVENGRGRLILDGSLSNSYAGSTTVQQGNLILSKTNAVAVPGPLSIGNNLDGSNAEVVFLLQNGQLISTAPLTVNPSGLLNVGNGNYVTANVGALTGSGAITIPDGSLGVGNDNSSSTFAGAISGLGAFDKFGSGTLTLTGNGSLNGPVYIVGGQLLINGSLASASIIDYPQAVLGGTGSVGTINSTGLVNPGTGGLGILNSGNASLNSGSTFNVNLNGTSPGSGYTELNVTGTVSLTGAALQAAMGFRGASNNQYMIIQNDGVDTVTGTFAGLPEGATVVANNGVHFTISYKGGTGNDVVLTQTSLPPQPNFSGIAKLGGGSIQLAGTGVSNLQYTVLANTNVATTNWVPIGSAIANGLGALLFTDPNATNFNQRFYRFSWP